MGKTEYLRHASKHDSSHNIHRSILLRSKSEELPLIALAKRLHLIKKTLKVIS